MTTIRQIDPNWDGKSCPNCGNSTLISPTRFSIIKRCAVCGTFFVEKESKDEEDDGK